MQLLFWGNLYYFITMTSDLEMPEQEAVQVRSGNEQNTALIEGNNSENEKTVRKSKENKLADTSFNSSPSPPTLTPIRGLDNQVRNVHVSGTQPYI